MEKIEKKENGYLVGILGSLLGGLIATLPWILLYVYAEMMYSYLALLIAVGALKGYELCRGKIDKKLPFIIGIVSVFSITVATLVIIPNLLLVQEAGATSLRAFKALYSYDAFKEAMIHDYIFSLLFTFIGAGGVIMSIRQQVKSGKKKIDLSANMMKPSDEDMASIKDIFEKRKAYDVDHKIEKDEFMKLVKDKGVTLNFMLSKGFVVYKKGGYYYSMDAEAHPNRKQTKIVLITFGVLFGVMALLFVLIGIFG